VVLPETTKLSGTLYRILLLSPEELAAFRKGAAVQDPNLVSYWSADRNSVKLKFKSEALADHCEFKNKKAVLIEKEAKGRCLVNTDDFLSRANLFKTHTQALLSEDIVVKNTPHYATITKKDTAR
jgi:hypothetical protein